MIFKTMAKNTKSLLNIINFKIKVSKSANNAETCKNQGKRSEEHESYKHLVILENDENQTRNKKKSIVENIY